MIYKLCKKQLIGRIVISYQINLSNHAESMQNYDKYECDLDMLEINSRKLQGYRYEKYNYLKL